ncbi:FtsX-like permease family protein [Candidatus Cyrtobacter comes]|nr:FtsX-like permease family protein [Candidatus Cyrtobacter comes]
MWLAWRYIKAKHREGFISVSALFSFLGIFIGVASLIIIISIMDGYERDFISRMLGINGHITVIDPPDPKNLLMDIKKLPNVNFAAEVLFENGIIASKYNSKGVFIRCMEFVDIMEKPIISGDVKNINEEFGIILGEEVAMEINAKVGDSIKLISTMIDTSAIASIPRSKTFKVSAIFNSGMHEYDSTTVFIPLKYGKMLFLNSKEEFGYIEVITKDISLIDSVVSQILNIDRSLEVVDWKRSNRALTDAIEMERNVMFFILFLIIIVASFNMISAITMMVQSKNKEIAILKIMGMESISIMRIFLFSGCIICFSATFLGMLFGIIVTLNLENIKFFIESMLSITIFDPQVYFLKNIPVKLSPLTVVYICMLSSCISILSALYPSFKASRKMPVSILRDDL